MKLITTIITLALTAAITAAQPVITDGSPASATVTLTVIIPEKTRIESIEQKHSIIVTADDVRNGYKEVSNAATLNVWSNSPDGYYLQHRIVNFTDESGSTPTGFIVLLEVAGTNDLQPVSSEIQYIYQGHPSTSNREMVRITLKLMIGPHAKPGVYTLDSDFTANCL